jgi:replication factor C small subunit
MEDFRPASLGDLVGQKATLARLRRILDGVRVGIVAPPHLLFHGPPGVGKTAAARAFAREALGEYYDSCFNELKAFDDRSATAILGMIAQSERPPPDGGPFRIQFIDEVEALAPDAQLNLRPAMEREGGWSVYILSCNDLQGLSKALQSRSTLLEFGPVEPTEMRRLLELALAKTPFQLEPAVLDSIVEHARGIPREAIKLLLEEGGSRPAAR